MGQKAFKSKRKIHKIGVTNDTLSGSIIWVNLGGRPS